MKIPRSLEIPVELIMTPIGHLFIVTTSAKFKPDIQGRWCKAFIIELSTDELLH